MLIRYYGHVGQRTGYGHAANETCMAILDAGLDLEISTPGTELHTRYMPLATCIKREADLTPRPDVVIVHTLPGHCQKVLSMSGVQAGLSIAYTTWEGVSAPYNFRHSPFDRVWVPSRATCRALQRGGLVSVVPHAYDPVYQAASTDEVLAWTRERLESEVYTFQYVGAWSARKNVDGLIRAFIRAFDLDDRVRLLIHSPDAPASALELARVSSGVHPDRHPSIVVERAWKSDLEMSRWRQRADCFVTATRGESWNLPAFDAMLSGQHVIAPHGQGSDDFLTDTTAVLYSAAWTPAFWDARIVDTSTGKAIRPVGVDWLDARALWHEPDLDGLANCMVDAWNGRAHLTVNYDPAARFGRAAVGRLIRNLLEGEST